jgi:hypothetical protein
MQYEITVPLGSRSVPVRLAPEKAQLTGAC